MKRDIFIKKIITRNVYLRIKKCFQRNLVTSTVPFESSENGEKQLHIPVMLNEVLDYLVRDEKCKTFKVNLIVIRISVKVLIKYD